MTQQVSTTQTMTLATDARSGLPLGLAHKPGALLVLGDYGCGKTFVLKKLLKDTLQDDGRNALIFDALGGHAYDHIYDALSSGTPYSVTSSEAGSLYTGAVVSGLLGALADESLTHLFFDPIDRCLKIPEISEAFGAARSLGRFAVGAAGPHILLDEAAGPLLKAEPSLLLMSTSEDACPEAVMSLLERSSFSRGVLRDLRPGEALYASPHHDPTPIRFDLSPEEIALFSGTPEGKESRG